MKVLVFGAKGMLGTALMDVFAGHDLVGADKKDVDITDALAVEELVRQTGPELIINAAAFTDVDGAEERRDAAYAVNCDGVKNIAVAALEVDAIMVHYSTDYVFPGDIAEGYTEDDEPGPAVNVYGASKLAGETALMEVNPQFYLLRTAWLYGPNGKNFVETMLRLGGQWLGKPLQVVNDQHGSPTYTYDLAQATREVVEKKYPFGVYHGVNRGIATWHDFAKEIFKQAGMRDVEVQAVTSSAFPRPARRPKYSVLVNTRGPKMRYWQDALRAYLNSRS